MYKIYLFLACELLVFYTAESTPPTSFNICKSEDSKCIVESANLFLPTFAAGIPEYHVETLDPLKIKSINASDSTILFELNDLNVVGLKNCEVKKASRDKANSKIHLTLSCTATLDGYYLLKGFVLVEVFGKGKIHVDLNAALFDVTISLDEKTGDDGKLHWNAKSFQFNVDLKEKCKLVFENLNKGNEVLEQASNALLRDSPNAVILEIGLPVFKAIFNIIMKNVNHMFKVMPAKDLSKD